MASPLGLSITGRSATKKLQPFVSVPHKETGSPFDRTAARPPVLDPAGVEPSLAALAASGGAGGSVNVFTRAYTTGRPDPRQFLSRHSGYGGAPTQGAKLGASASPVRDAGRLSSPPKSGAKSPRTNPPNTMLRLMYERGDLPCVIDLRGVHNRLQWRVEISKLDYSVYLPLFVDGLREEEMPYKFLADQGVTDLLAAGGQKILPAVPQLIMPLRAALNTRRRDVLIRTLSALKQLILADVGLPGGPVIAQALVPYFRQLLPVLNIFRCSNRNIGDGIDYAQRHGQVLGDRIEEVLRLLHAHGGPDAYVNLKYLIPDFSVVA